MTEDFPIEEKSEISKTMEWTSKRIEDAVNYGLYCEVLVWALWNMQANPEMTVEQAIEHGCQEWDI